MSQILISGVLCVWNEQDLVTRAIDNIYDVVDELVILDSESTDNTVEVIKQFPDQRNKIRLFKLRFKDRLMDYHHRHHTGDQKNSAISKVRGNFLWNVMLKGKDSKVLSAILKKVLDKDFKKYRGISLAVDVDPL